MSETKAEKLHRCYGGPDRIEWMRWQPSIISGRTPCVSAHIRNGGKGRKADACWTVPLTWDEHHELDTKGHKTFAAKYGVDLDHEAAITDARWEVHVATAHQKPQPTPHGGQE